MPSIQLGPIVIGVKNIENSKNFYLNVFEVEIDSQSENFLNCHLGETNIQLEEDSPNRFPNWAENNVGTYKNSEFIVDNMNDFLVKVIEFGGSIISQPKATSWGGNIAEIADLDGNIFLISEK